MSSRQARAGGALLLALVVCAYLWPVLFGGQTLSPSALLYDFVPFSPGAPPDFQSYYNNFLSDAALQFEPWHRFAREQLRSGTFPSWNPHVLGGAPFFANAQTGLGSPFLVPLWILPFNYGLGVVAALKLWAAGFGTFLLARELRLGFWPSALAAAGFALCAFNILWLSHPHSAVAPMLPWALWLAERVMTRGRAVDALLLALPCAVAFFGGHPGTQVHLAFGLLLYAAMRAAFGGGEERLRRVALVVAGAAGGVAMAAVVLLPAALLVPGSNGELLRRTQGFTLSLESVITLAFPDFSGRPSAIAVDDFADNYQERTMFAGTVTLLLAPLGLFWSKNWRPAAPFAVLAAIGLAVALGVQPFHWVISQMPVLDTVRNARMILYVQLSVALLGAFGLERALAGELPRRTALLLIGGALIGGLVGLLALSPSLDDMERTVSHFLTGEDFRQQPDVIRATSVSWWLLLVAGTGLALTLPRRMRTAALVLVVLLVAVDLGRFVNGYQPMGPAERLSAPRMPAVRALQRTVGDGRSVGLGFLFPADVNMLFGLRDVRGYDPPDPPLRYARLWSFANPGTRQDGLNFGKLTRDSRRVIDVLGARAVLAPAAPRLRVPGWRLVHTNVDGLVYRNDLAAPRVVVPSRVQRAGTERDALRALLSPRFDPRRHAVVEGQASRGAGTARVVRDELASVELRASMRQDGLLVLNDSLRDGWSVRVDGREAKPVRVNSVFRGVSVPSGQHRVEWSYRVPGLVAGAVISLGACLSWLAIALYLWRIRGSRLARPPGARAPSAAAPRRRPK